MENVVISYLTSVADSLHLAPVITIVRIIKFTEWPICLEITLCAVVN